MTLINTKLLEMARGDKPAELVLKNAAIVDVFQEELRETDVALADGIILGTGDYQGQREIDLSGNILSPAFIDGHMHLESAMVDVEETARRLISLGTTTVVVDPHEIANVAGLDGIRYLLYQGRKQPWNFKMMLPSCVPTTELETAGAKLPAAELNKLKDKECVFGLGEVMDYPGVIKGDPKVQDKLELFNDNFIDGHAPGVTGKDLNTYLLSGVMADHECTTASEAREKVSKGMYVMIREGSVTRDLAQLLPEVNDKNINRFLFATDDRHPGDLLDEGHINYLIKKAVNKGMDPLKAIKLATINSAQALGLDKLGAIAPGYRADLVVFSDLNNLKIKKVFKDGKIAANEGSFILSEEKSLPTDKNKWKQIKKSVHNSINTGPINESDFELPSGGCYRVMELIEDQIITKKSDLNIKGKRPSLDTLKKENLVKLAVVERHQASGRVGLGLLRGYGLSSGAIATSISHDSHNIITAGLKAADMAAAVRAVKEMQGGIAVVDNGEIKAQLALPIAGLMSHQSMEEVDEKLENLRSAAHSQGVDVADPFMTISFMALPVIPALKITDRGLFDVEKFSHVSLVKDK